MQLLDRIEARRFVGREFLLFLWFESELFEGTLSTVAHGSFGFWIERRIVLSAGKEVTQIKGAYPAGSREAKESLQRGKLPELAGIHVSLREHEMNFVLKADTLALSGLSLAAVLDGGAEEEGAGLPPAELLGPPQRKKKGPARGESDAAHEAFYDRMQRTRELEELLEALYRDFLALRLGPAWEAFVEPMLKTWCAGDEGTELDSDGYREKRENALGGKKRR